MKSTFTKILRIVLALILLAFGINKFFKLLPLPELPEEAADFMGSLKATGYVLPVIGTVEIVIGLLLLINKAVPFALLLLVPISVNIILYHFFMDLPDIGGALVVAAINVVLIYKHWKLYRPLFH